MSDSTTTSKKRELDVAALMLELQTQRRRLALLTGLVVADTAMLITLLILSQ
ncbi:MAG: hypothetical protein QGH45_05785 [Myxococcota bacterium]|nr:hypothetical protein [Myxococcota bacterium]